MISSLPIAPPTSSTPPSFRARCVHCQQIGLFALIAGFLACNWRLSPGSEVPDTVYRGLLIVDAECSRCRGRRKSAIRLVNSAGITEQ